MTNRSPAPRTPDSVCAHPLPVARASVRSGALPAALLYILASLAASAQVAPATAPVKGPEEEAVALSPFVVSSTQDVGYLAGSTLAGSRLNTAIKDTPVTIDVFTPELLQDLGATSLEEAMAYANNLQTDEGDTDRLINGDSQVSPRAAYQFRSRGFLGTRARNYFETELPLELYMADRLDESRGPNSILFGIGSPGGIVNITTKSPLNHNALQTELKTGSWDLFRATVDANYVLVPDKLAVRINAMYNDQKHWRDHLFTVKRGANFAVKWQPTRKTIINADYEEGDLRGTIVQNFSTIDRLTAWIAAGSTITSTTGTTGVSAADQARALAKFAAADRFTYVANQGILYNARHEYTSNGSQLGVETTGVPFVRNNDLIPYKTNFAGPGARANHNYRVGQFTVDQIINDIFSAQVAYYHEEGRWKNYDVNAGTVAISSTVRPDPNKYYRAPTVSSGQLFALDGFTFERDATGTLNPNVGRPYFEANWRRRLSTMDSDTVRATLSGSFDFGAVLGRHRIAGLVQRLWKTNSFNSAVETFVGNPAGTVTSPTANNNRLVRRQYGTYGDSTSFSAPDWSTRPNISINLGGKTYVTDFVPAQAPLRSERVVDSFILADQASFWNSRIVATAGYRIDKLRQDRTETMFDRTGIWAGTTGIPVLNPNDVTTFKFEGKTRTLGLMFHLTKSVSLFANTSENIGLPDFTFVLGPDGTVPPPPEGKGIEGGVQLTLFKGRLFGRVTYYDTEQINVTNGMGVNNAFTPSYNYILQTVAPYYNAAQLEKYPDLRPVSQANADTVDSSSKGVESRWILNVTSKFRLLANYSYTSQAKDNPYRRTYPLYQQLTQFIADLDAANPNAAGPGLGVSGLTTRNPSPPGPDTETIGQELAFRLEDLDSRALDFVQASGARKHKASVTGVYSFSEGRRKGWAVGGGARYQSAMLVGYKPSTGEQFYGNDSFLMDAMVRYSTRFQLMGKGTRVDFQLNIRNLLDNQDLQIKRTTDNPADVLRWNFQTPREFVFSTTVKF